MIPLAEIEAARARIAPYAVRTPLVRLPVEGPDEIWLKLENLQPFACFKIRAAANLFGSLSDAGPWRVRCPVDNAGANTLAPHV